MATKICVVCKKPLKDDWNRLYKTGLVCNTCLKIIEKKLYPRLISPRAYKEINYIIKMKNGN